MGVLEKNKKKSEKSPSALLLSLYDENLPLGIRKHLLSQLCQDDGEGEEVVQRLLADGRAGGSESVYRQKVEELHALLEEMKSGPLRTGPFLRTVGRVGAAARAEVVLQDGQRVVAAVPESTAVGDLARGET